MADESQLREEVAELRRQLATQQKTVVVREKGGGAGGVFWGLFHFFITLPLVLFMACSGCVGVNMISP